MSSKIPIKNIYHLLSYAWDVLPRAQLVNINGTENFDFSTKLIMIFLDQVQCLIKSGLGKRYNEIEDELKTIKGKISWNESTSTLRKRNSLICIHDEFSEDYIFNQIVKATLKNLLKINGLDINLYKIIKRSLDHFSNVSDYDLGQLMLRNYHYDNLDKKRYLFICKLSEMIFYSLMPTEDNGTFKFIDFIKDEDKMRTLFEKFVHNFFKQKLSGRAKVKRDELRWNFIQNDQTYFLPKMITDTTIKYDDKIIIIETKFTHKLLEKSFRSEKRTLNSGHLYQLTSYLNNYITPLKLKGLLLYPSIGEDVRLSYISNDFEIKIMTVDLSKDWQEVENELLTIISA